MSGVSDRSILDAIEAFLTAHGYAPTLRELGECCGLSHVVVRRRLVRLEHAGLIRRDYATARSLVVLVARGVTNGT